MKNWSLNTKIYLLLGIMILAAASITYLSIDKLGSLNESMLKMTSGPVKRQKMLMDIQANYFLQMISEKNYLDSDTEGERQEFVTRFNDLEATVMKIYNEVLPNLIVKNQENLKSFMASYKEFLALNNKVKVLVQQNKLSEAKELSKVEGRNLRRTIEAKLKEIMDVNVELVNTTVKNSDELYRNSRSFLLLISSVSICLSLGLSYFVLRALAKVMGQVIASLSDNSNEVTSAAQQIASSSEELSQAATEQAASLEETAASIEEMNSMVQKNAENAQRTSDLSHSSSITAEKGQKVIKDMISAIDDISASNNTIMVQIDDSNRKISEIVNVISEIGEKTKVINDIVFQTKLLSFNASVEAARAGEHGKGFAVVAQEVGSLAQMSGNAAMEISSMLEDSIKKVEDIVNETKQKVSSLVTVGKSKVEAGGKIAKECGQVFEEIVHNVNSVTQMAGEISTACQEQAQGVQEITKAMSQLDQVTQTNAATSEEAASSAEELSSKADSLRSVVKILQTTIHGGEGKNENESTPVRGSMQNVISLQQQRVRKIEIPKKNHKKTSVFVGNIPAENDSRFKEV